MPQYNSQDDLFSSDSHFLSPALPSLRKYPSRHQHLNARKSSASLRAATSLVIDVDIPSGGGNGRHHSLAHELAVALMPEPSTGSKLLAEEFGIEYDEGAEGIDPVPGHDGLSGNEFANSEVDAPSFASELGDTSTSDASLPDSTLDSDEPDHCELIFSSSTPSRNEVQQNKSEQDAMEVLARDLESTDKFLNHLRTIDLDLGTSTSQQISLEGIASDVIRHINESVRDREGQVRELLECEREFRKISGEVGGNDVLGVLDELTGVDELLDKVPAHHDTKVETKRLDVVVEEELGSPRNMSHDWELDPDRPHLGDEDYGFPEVASPAKESFPPPPPLVGPLTPASTVPQLSHFRTSTASLVSNLTILSDHAQVNGAATAEAGRKIRALKNKLGSWRTEWDGAERSRQRIERWEAGIVEGDLNSPSRMTSKRLDGRIIVQEHLRAFELALADAATKTQAIMAIMAR